MGPSLYIWSIVDQNVVRQLLATNATSIQACYSEPGMVKSMDFGIRGPEFKFCLAAV